MEKLLLKIYGMPRLTQSLKTISHIAVALGVVSYALLLFMGYERELTTMLKLVLVSSVPFLLVSLMRRVINAPRPYELYGFYEKRPKGKSGESFPSRHVFSAFLISTLSIPFSIPLFIINTVISFVLAVCRVLTGMHFVRDVVAAALIGIISGVIGIFILI